MARESNKLENAIEELIEELQEAANEAGERIAEFLERASVRERITAVASSVEALRVELIRHLRGEAARKGGAKETAAQPPAYEDMPVAELRKLASEREIPGRSSMTKAELIEALRGS